MLIVTKAELPNAEEVRAWLEQHVGRPVLSLSAVTGAGLSEFWLPDACWKNGKSCTGPVKPFAETL